MWCRKSTNLEQREEKTERDVTDGSGMYCVLSFTDQDVVLFQAAAVGSPKLPLGAMGNIISMFLNKVVSDRHMERTC